MPLSESRLTAIFFSDIDGSGDLKSKFGEFLYDSALERHNSIFQQVASEYAVKTVKHTGDGYLAICDGVARMIQCAMAFQDGMRREGWQQVSLSSRVGIHFGEISHCEMNGLPDVRGSHVDIASRIMSLALGGQILLSREAYDMGKNYVVEHPPFNGEMMKIHWQNHGEYAVKGFGILSIFEIGAAGLAPFVQPGESDKVKRYRPSNAATPKHRADFDEAILWRLLCHIRCHGKEVLAIKEIETNIDLCNASLPNGEVPIIAAIQNGRSKLVSFLLRQKQLDIDQRDSYGTTALLKAASVNDLDLIKTLIERGADPKAESRAHGNAIYEATFGGTPKALDIVKYLESLGVAVNQESQDGFIPLSVAIWRGGAIKIIEYLYERTSDHQIEDLYGETLFYKAFKHQNFDALNFLIRKGCHSERPPRERPLERGTELYRATHEGNAKRVLELITGGDDVNNGEQLFERSPLHEAVENAHLQIVELLLRCKADVFRKNNHGRIPKDLLPLTSGHLIRRQIRQTLDDAEQQSVREHPFYPV